MRAASSTSWVEGFGVQGLGLESKVSVLGFGVYGFEAWVSSLKVSVLGFTVYGLRFWVQGFGFWV